MPKEQKKRKCFEELTLADDFMFGKVMTDLNVAKLFIEKLFGKRVVSITDPTAQAAVKPQYGSRGVRFDVLFEGDKTIYDIEMQQDGSDSEEEQNRLLRRVRYYQGIIAVDNMKPGNEFELLPNSTVIFICTFDPFGLGAAYYEMHRYIHAAGSGTYNPAKDGEHTIFLSTKYKDANAPSDIMEFLNYIRNPAVGEDTTSLLVSYAHSVVNRMRRDRGVKEEFMRYEEKMQEKFKEGVESLLTRLQREGKLSAQDAVELRKEYGLAPKDTVSRPLQNLQFS